MAIVINGSGTVTGLAVGGLPDGTVDAGTLATNSVDSAELIDGAVDDSHMAAMAASKLTGALPAISGASLTNLPSGGKVLQVVIGVDSTASTIATTTYTDTGLSAAITPSSTSSKILCQWTSQVFLGKNEGMGVQLVRDSTNIYTSEGFREIFTYSSATGQQEESRSSWIHLDSPATTSAITYKIQVASFGSKSINLNNDGNETQLLLMEIGA